MKSKTKYFVFLMLLVTLSIITIIILNDKNEIKLDNVKLNEVKDTKGLALMLEQTNGTYEETTDTEWPSEGYSFNKHMSGCIDSNGNTIENTLTYKNGTIKLKTKHNTYCYIYFDIDRPATEELLATVSSEQLWDSTLEDDGYRYVGTNPDNYICFGTTDQEECMNDTDKYMYRIIGIFEDSNGIQHLKLIKKEALNTAYAWHSDYTTDTNWDESDLYKGINGSYFATNSEYSYMQDSAWNNLITTWDYTATNTKTYENYMNNKVFGIYYRYTSVRDGYLHELNRSKKIEAKCYYDASTIADCTIGIWTNVPTKIGLIYVSDYQLSLGESSLDYVNNTNYSTMKGAWMHLSNNDSAGLSTTIVGPPSSHEWTMTRYGSNGSYYNAFIAYSNGDIYYDWVGSPTVSVRPVFYLEVDTKLDKGTGTIDDPYTIEISPNLREYCEEYNNINECIKKEENNIEEVSDLWNSTLEEDGIRYVGTNPNNYVCFGTTNQEECTSDTDKYMYRIIGIFENETGNRHLKLIKKEALNTSYAWHSDYKTDTDWEESDLYKGINDSYFLNNSTYSYLQNSSWLNKIVDWNYIAANTLTSESNGLNYQDSVTINDIYLHEMNRSTKTSSIGEWKIINAKAGLIYANDYLLSLGKKVLNYTSYTNREILKTGWMHLSNNDEDSPAIYELIMTRSGAEGEWYRSWRVGPEGDIFNPRTDTSLSIRPVFYLNENIKITSGKGSITEPFIIS